MCWGLLPTQALALLDLGASRDCRRRAEHGKGGYKSKEAASFHAPYHMQMCAGFTINVA